MQPRRYVQQLKSTTSETVVIDPATSNLKATFKLDNVDARLGTDWCYAQQIRLYIETTFDQAASGGSIVRPDQLYRALSSIKLSCDDLGVIYGEGDLNGPALGLIAQIVSRGYQLPWYLRSDIPAADGDTSIVLPIDIPLGHRCFRKGHQTGVWTGFLKNNGILEVNLAASTWPAAASTGAATKAPTQIRAEMIYSAEPEARLPSLWHWRLRSTPASESKHTIKNLCQGAGIKGATGVGKVAFLAYLSNLAGLGGAGAINNITRVYPRDRGQPSHNLGTPFYGPASFLAGFVEETRRAAIFGTGQGGAYPLQLGTTVDGSPNAATALFLPYFWPDPSGQDVSKLQEVSGDYYLEHDYTAVPNATASWLSLEQSYLTQAQQDFLMGSRMGLPAGAFKAYPKVDRQLHNADDPAGVAEQQKKLRGLPTKIRKV